MKWNHAAGVFGVSSAIALALAAPACSSEDAATTGAGTADSGTADSASDAGGSGTVGETVSVLVTVAAGGTLTDKAGTVTLVIPPGAIEKDATLTLLVDAPTSGAIANVYGFSPDVFRFSKPARITIKAAAPAGKQAAVALEQGGTWKAFAGSSLDAAKGTVRADVDQLGKYSVVSADVVAPLTVPTTCAEAVTKFTACGGDPIGTWTHVKWCADAIPQIRASCTEGTYLSEITTDQTVTFVSGTKQSSAAAATSKQTYDVPLSCLREGLTCSDVEAALEASCSAGSAANCVCTKSLPSELTESTSKYSVTATKLTISDASGSLLDENEICVRGDLLYLRRSVLAGEKGIGNIEVFQRK